jgi:hypothetical protein
VKATEAKLLSFLQKSPQFVIPIYQRTYSWTEKECRQLWDDVRRAGRSAHIPVHFLGSVVYVEETLSTNTSRSPQLVIDGQQRLTSLFAVLTGRPVLTKTYEEKRIRIGFRPEDELFEVTDAAIEKDPHFIPDITALWADGYRTTARRFITRLREGREDDPLTEEEEDELEDRINRVHDLRDFPFQVVELGASADEEQVAEIFVRINSEGVKLNQADFILTRMSVPWRISVPPARACSC